MTGTHQDKTLRGALPEPGEGTVILTLPPQPLPSPAPHPETPPVDPADLKARRRKRRRRRWAWRAAGVLITVPFLFTVIFSLGIVGRQVAAPSWLKADVEARATELLGGGSLRFGGLQLTLGADLHPRVVITNAELRDVEGQLIAQVPRLTANLSPRGLLAGEVLVQEVDLSALQIRLRRSADGAVALEVGTSGGGAQQAGSFVDLLDNIDGALEAPRLAALEQVRVTGMIVNYDDARAGRSWTVDGGRLTLDLGYHLVALRGDVSLLSGRAYLTELGLSYESPKGSSEAALSIEIENGIARDLATQAAALSWLGVLDAPLSASIRGEIDARGALGPMNAALELGEGALRPTEATRPIPFESASAYVTYDPATNVLHFDRLGLVSLWGQFTGTGRFFLRAFENGFPQELWGQFDLAQIELNPAELYPEPVRVGDGSIALRMIPEPFRLEVAELAVSEGDGRVTGRADIRAAEAGWSVRGDLSMAHLTTDKLLSLWPLTLRPNTRKWFAENLQTGRVDTATMALRSTPGETAIAAISFEYSDLTLQFMRTMPPIEGAAGFGVWENDSLTMVVEDGLVRAPQGGAMVLPGSVFTIPNTRMKDPPATIALALRGTLTAALSVLDRPPFEFLTKANLPVTLADARAVMRGSITLPLMERIPRDDILFSVAATLEDVRSSQLVQGRQFASTRLDVQADNNGMEVSGPWRIGQVPMAGRFTQAFRDNADREADISATVELSERFLDEFGIGLPPGMMRGDGSAEVNLSLARGRPPNFSLDSTLTGLRLALPSIGFTKGAGTSGRLSIAGRLGDAPEIDRFLLAAPGLSAAGDLDLAANGRLAAANFPDLRVGDWLRAPVRLRDRGAGNPMGVTIGGGRLDMRGLPDGEGAGTKPPMSIALDRLVIAEGLSLTGFQGEFSGGAGLSGNFNALVNGRGAVRGTVVPRDAGRTAIRLQSDDAGSVISAAGYLENAVGGTMDLTLLPAAGEGSFDGQLAIEDIRVRDAPALAGLLDAISVVGLLQQLDGQGLAFSNVDARFRLDPDRITITQSSAVGASLGISLDGTYLTASKQMDFQGVVSPLYLLNGIGAVLTRPGEGLIGFNFTLRGPVGDTRVQVNPLSAFTPGMFREIFRRPPPRVGQ